LTRKKVGLVFYGKLLNGEVTRFTGKENGSIEGTLAGFYSIAKDLLAVTGAAIIAGLAGLFSN